MLINYAYTSQVLPKAILLEPVRYLNYYEIGKPYINCPAITDFYKNVFVIPMPLDFYCKIALDKEQVIFKESNLQIEVARAFCQIQGSSDLSYDMQFSPLEITYWSDEDCVTEAWGPPMNNLLNIGGCYNIKNWIRPNHSAYLIPKKATELVLDFKKGNPWLFIKFNSEKKIDLKYNYDLAILEEAKKMARSSSLISGVKKYFKKFNKIRPRKLTK